MPQRGGKESPRAKRWAYLAPSEAIAGIERQRRKLKEELEQDHIRPSEALRREEELKAREEQARKTLELCELGEERVADTPSEVELAEDAGQNVFQQTQSGWKTAYDGSSERLDDTKGVRAIGYPLSLPETVSPPRARLRFEPQWTVGTRGRRRCTRLRAQAQEVADPQAVEEVGEQLRGICEELADEDVILSVKDRQKLEDQRDKLKAYVDGAVGLGVHTRTLGGRGDGQVVGASIARALKRISQVHPQLHAHLDASIKTPYSDAIRYEPPEPTAWDVLM